MSWEIWEGKFWGTIVVLKQNVYILSISPLSYPSWKIFALAFLYSSLSGWFGFPSWVYFSKDVFWLTVSLQFISGLNLCFPAILLLWTSTSFEHWFENVHLFWHEKTFISSARIIWNFPRKPWFIPHEVVFHSPGSHISFPGKSYFFPQEVIFLSPESLFFLQSSITASGGSFYLSNLYFPVKVDVTIFLLSSLRVDSLQPVALNYSSGWQVFWYCKDNSLWNLYKW